MFFARFDYKQKISLGVGVLVFVLVLSFFIGYKLKDFREKTNFGEDSITNTPVEIKILRSQEEIANSYKQSMDRVINRLDAVQSREEIITISESSFFDIYVPTDLKDIHLQKMLAVRKLGEQADLSSGELKEKIILIINELLLANQKIIDSLKSI